MPNGDRLASVSPLDIIRHHFGGHLRAVKAMLRAFAQRIVEPSWVATLASAVAHPQGGRAPGRPRTEPEGSPGRNDLDRPERPGDRPLGGDADEEVQGRRAC